MRPVRGSHEGSPGTWREKEEQTGSVGAADQNTSEVTLKDVRQQTGGFLGVFKKALKVERTWPQAKCNKRCNHRRLERLGSPGLAAPTGGEKHPPPPRGGLHGP